MDYDYRLSVIIVPHDGLFPLEPCLYALGRAVRDLDAEILPICVDPSGDRSDGVRSRFAEITFIDMPSDANATCFVNQLIRQCRGEYVLLLHPDTLIGEDCLRTLCCFMDEHAYDVGAVGLKMLDSHGAFLPESRRRFPLPKALGYHFLGLSGLLPRSKRYVPDGKARPSTANVRRVDIVSEAFVLINRRALEQAGLPDEAFPFASAYPEWFYRLSTAGFRNFYFPERMLHLGSEASRRGDRVHVNLRYDALTLFYEKHFPCARAVAFLIRLRKRLALLAERRTKVRKPKRRRVFAICHDEHLEAIKDAVSTRTGVSTDITQLNPARRRPVDAATDRRVQMQAYTDVVFCFPDVTFDQILLFMDKTQAAVTCHIYLTDAKQLVSYEPA
jgi:GT2 family glycosyltransferase